MTHPKATKFIKQDQHRKITTNRQRYQNAEEREAAEWQRLRILAGVEAKPMTTAKA